MNTALAAVVLQLALRHPNGVGRPDRCAPVHVNGEWLAHKDSAAHRYAVEMVKALAATARFDLVVHAPADAPTAEHGWEHCDRMEVRRSRFTGAAFEQVYLPTVTAGRVLLNFAGTAPMIKRHQLVTMHDAMPFRCPSEFGRRSLQRHLLAYRWLGRTVDGLVTDSLYSAHELSDVLRIDVERFIVAGGAADSLRDVHPTRPRIPLRGDDYLVIGTAAPHENVRSTAATIAKSGRSVVVVGMDRPEDHFDTSVVFAEHVGDAELVWLYRNCKALILPPTYAGFGLSALEAQAMTCPVVCADSTALPEVCRDAALYFDPEEPDTLTAQLDRLDSEIGLADDLRRRGLVNAERYSWSDSARKIIEWVDALHCRVARC